VPLRRCPHKIKFREAVYLTRAMLSMVAPARIMFPRLTEHAL